MKLERVLIANRGEVAKRLIRYYAGQGVESVVAFSEPDAEQGYLDEADYAVYLNGRTVRETYMDPHRVVAAAMDAGCDAIHPGYCFLAERADFYALAFTANLAVVGSDPSVLPHVVDRSNLLKVGRELGLPVIPASDVVPEGHDGIEQAAAVGLPLFVKGVHGGAMELVRDFSELPSALEAVRAAAEVVSGVRDVYLERAVGAVRQLGTTVVVDRHGSDVFLGHADASLELRYSSWIEELGPEVAPELHDRLGDAALRLASALGWVGVGRVRWALLPGDAWYLLGFSARLTTGFDLAEEVYGVDLLDAQYRTLVGEALEWSQPERGTQPYGIQIRVLHVDPATGTRPPGVLEELVLPEGIVASVGVDVGTEVGPDTDPLLAKLTVTAPSRQAAVVKARAALNDLVVRGVATNLPLLERLFSSELMWRGGTDVRTLHDLVGGTGDGAPDA